jgi:sensor histidine kinase YesM
MQVQIAGANIGPFTADNPTASIVGRQSNSYRKEEERRERQQRERYEAERREREIEEERRVLEVRRGCG